jgi:hypothetical protein
LNGYPVGIESELRLVTMSALGFTNVAGIPRFEQKLFCVAAFPEKPIYRRSERIG